MPHKCIQVSEEGFLGSMYMKTGKVLTTAAAQYSLHAPPNVQVWHKAFFWWVQTQGWSPHEPSMAKNTYGPVGIPLIRGASGARQHLPHKEDKSLGDGPLRPEEISSCQDTLGQIRATASMASRSATLQLERHSAITAAALLYQLSS